MNLLLETRETRHNTKKPSTHRFRLGVHPMHEPRLESLLQDLKNTDELVRDRATQALWQIWFEQKGSTGLEVIRRIQLLIESGDLSGAEIRLTQLIADQPDFAEAWNRRAVLYYCQGRYRKAAADCETVIQLNPFHFGALHGLGLCHAALGDYRSAIQSFHRALDLQPYCLANQRLILECNARLS
jgi:tetratricopeptide (TPR) repeat protein